MPRRADTEHMVEGGSDVDGTVDTAVRWKPPRWAAPIALLLCICGIAVASYLTYAHYTDVSNLACSDRGKINCAKVTTSSQSHFLGMPVAVLGLAYFVAMTALCLPWAWRRQEPIVRYARLAAAAGGLVMILWLVYAELFIIDAICIYCTVVHGLTLLLFLLVTAATVSGTVRPEFADDDYLDYGDEDEDDYAEDPAPVDDARLTKTD